jgi:hypothetical protein
VVALVFCLWFYLTAPVILDLSYSFFKSKRT